MILKRGECSYQELKNKLLSSLGTTRTKFYVYVNLVTGEIIALKRFAEKDASKFKFIGEAKGVGKELIKELKTVIYDYDKMCKLTKTQVIRQFGTKGLMKCAYICTLPNPFYKCAGDMIWFDKYVIKTNLAKAKC